MVDWINTLSVQMQLTLAFSPHDSLGPDFVVASLEWISSDYWYNRGTPLFCQTNISPDFAEWAYLYLNWMWESQNFIIHWSSPDDATMQSSAGRDTPQRLENKIEVSWVRWLTSSNITCSCNPNYLRLLLFEEDIFNVRYICCVHTLFHRLTGTWAGVLAISLRNILKVNSIQFQSQSTPMFFVI